MIDLLNYLTNFKNNTQFMRKVSSVFILLAIAVTFSSCWMEAKGKKHKVEVGARRASNDDGKVKK